MIPVLAFSGHRGLDADDLSLVAEGAGRCSSIAVRRKATKERPSISSSFVTRRQVPAGSFECARVTTKILLATFTRLYPRNQTCCGHTRAPFDFHDWRHTTLNLGIRFSNKRSVQLNLHRMDPVDRYDYLCGQTWIVQQREWLSGACERENAMTESTHALSAAIDRELHADYLPTLTKPLPRELEDLIAQLVVFEFGKRGSTERSVEVLQSSIAHPGPQP
jgi:hypothetical protein